MTSEELNNLYFDWMCQLVSDDEHENYRDLLYFLHSVQFTYTIDMDANRESDGEALRYRFGYECDYPDVMIASFLDDRPCSVLEMMVALSLRCEEQIMRDYDIGDRTCVWFWGMIRSLGLEEMEDRYFQEKAADYIIQRFLDRGYKSNGEWGLFTVHNPRRDMRDVEIWYQMCWYLNEYLKD